MLAILLGVTVAALADQSESSSQQPMGAPEVFLQVKYDGGVLDRIYLTQFRKERAAAVPARTGLCTELCHAGLGGNACGTTCLSLMPVGLKSALTNGNSTSQQYGQPRVDVCPELCENQLGEPLCDCVITPYAHTTNWTMVCEAFCRTDGYVVNGCPTCEADHSQITRQHLAVGRTLDTVEGWQTWCNAQCRQGHGGAACNCDRLPF